MELQFPKPNRLSREDLDRLLGGEDSAEVYALLEEWRASSPEGDDPLDMLAEALKATFGLPPRTREDILWRASQILGVPGRSTASRVSRPQRGVFQKHPLRRRVWYAVGGVTACVLAIVLGGHVGTPRFGGHGRVAVSAYMTGNGERANIALPDGNTVALDVASRLEVPADYLGGNHTLHLIGEALFVIKHQTGMPFTVITGADTARVLGTSFLVRHYGSDTMVVVVVREGKVAVRAGAAGAVVLATGRQVAVGRTGAMQLMQAEPGRFSFAMGVLTLASGPFPDAILALDRWYDADIRLGDSTLVTRRLTGEFAAGSLATLTELLEGTYNIRVVRIGRVLTLYGS